jgi:hypothetical protein
MAKYQVTYESDLPGKETQILCTNLDFQTATEISASLQADAFNEDGHDVSDGQYAVQPQLSKD